MPQSRVQTSVTLFGNAPWGFRISGGKEFNQPLVVTRVTPGSLASRSGVQSGDVLIAINNQYVSNMTQDECEVSVKQAVGSLHLVLEKNAATVTELPGGQFKVDGDRSVYTAVKDTQQRISKFNRSAKPFGAPDVPSKAEKAEEKPAESKAGFKSVAFQPSAKSQAQTSLPTAARGEPDGVNAAAESMSKVTLDAPEQQAPSSPAKSYDLKKYNRKIVPFSAPNASNNNNVSSATSEDDLPPPPDFLLSSNEPVRSGQYSSTVHTNLGKPKSTTSRKVIVSPSLDLYSQANAGNVYDAQVGDL